MKFSKIFNKENIITPLLFLVPGILFLNWAKSVWDSYGTEYNFGHAFIIIAPLLLFQIFIHKRIKKILKITILTITYVLLFLFLTFAILISSNSSNDITIIILYLVVIFDIVLIITLILSIISFLRYNKSYKKGLD